MKILWITLEEIELYIRLILLKTEHGYYNKGYEKSQVKC